MTERAEQPAVPEAAPQNVAVFRGAWLSLKRDGQEVSCRHAPSGFRSAPATVKGGA